MYRPDRPATSRVPADLPTAPPANPLPGPPYTFADACGRQWTVDVTHDALERVRTRFGIDLAAVVISGGSPVETLATPVDRLFEALHVLLESQLIGRGVGPREYFPQLFTTPPGPVARRAGRTVGALAPLVCEAAALALCRGLARLFPGTAFARAMVLDERRRAGYVRHPDGAADDDPCTFGLFA